MYVHIRVSNERYLLVCGNKRKHGYQHPSVAKLLEKKESRSGNKRKQGFQHPKVAKLLGNDRSRK